MLQTIRCRHWGCHFACADDDDDDDDFRADDYDDDDAADDDDADDDVGDDGADNGNDANQFTPPIRVDIGDAGVIEVQIGFLRTLDKICDRVTKEWLKHNWMAMPYNIYRGPRA